MLMFISIVITLIVLRKCGVYHKELGNSGITVHHVVNTFIYIFLFCISPIFALILFLIFDAKKVFNKLKTMKKEVT